MGTHKILQGHNERALKQKHLDCLTWPGIGPEGTREGTPPNRCLSYKKWTNVGWDYIFDLSDIVARQPVIDRWDGRESWLWENLELKNGDWALFDDPERYSYQILDTGDQNSWNKAKWSTAIALEDLQAYQDVKLLSVGSLFGNDRIVSNNAETEQWRMDTRRAQVCRHKVLTRISDKIAERLGGRGKYISFHLRLGDFFFKSLAPENMPQILDRALLKMFGLSPDTIALLAESRHLPPLETPEPGADGTTGEAEVVINDGTMGNSAAARNKKRIPPTVGKPVSGTPSTTSPTLQCRGPLYTAPSLKILNTPVFIATDSRHPLSDPNLRIFFDTFPCAFVMTDFTRPEAEGGVKELSGLKWLASAEDGLGLAKFLYPLLDAVIASKGSGLVGTPMSTFSQYAVRVLHPAYSVEA